MEKCISKIISVICITCTVAFPLLGSTVNAEEYTTPSQTRKGSWDFEYTGDVQYFKVPTDGYYGFELYGGQGGNNGSYKGGKGGYIKTVAKLNAGDILFINVGGGSGNTFNGGGIGKESNGGGATDIRLNTNLIKDRVFVAGGGGGASSSGDGGAGGTTNVGDLVVNPSKGKPEVLSTKHVHLGNETIGGDCYRIPIYHVHDGNETIGGECYKNPIYHTHVALGAVSNPVTGVDYIYDDEDGIVNTSEMCSVKGGCYNTPVKLYHHHTGSALSGGGCYTSPIYHQHTSSCYSQVQGRCSCTAYAGRWYPSPNGDTNGYLRCEVCGHGGHGPGGSCGASITTTALTCGKTTQILGYNLGCGKTEGQLHDTKYTLDCYKSLTNIDGYSLSCVKTSSTIEGYRLSCTKEYDNGVYEGQSGLYGGGGGYYGGKAGYLIYHSHSHSCPQHYTAAYEGCQCGSCYCRDSDHSIPVYQCRNCGHNHHQSYTGACAVGRHGAYTTYYCGKTPGVTIDAKASAMGGSSYNASGSDLLKTEAGVREGNGFCRITAVTSIEYDLNKGEFGESAPNYIWYDEDGVIDNPVREGYTFQGWDISNMEPPVYIGGKEYGSSSATRIKDTVFKNLRYNPGYVKFTAIWKDETKPSFSEVVYVNKQATDYNPKIYTPGEWTGQNVIASYTVTDTGSGIHSVRWNGIKYSNADKSSSVMDVDDWIINNTSDPYSFRNSKEFSTTGLYNGLIYARDNADTENKDHISNGQKNVETIPYGDIRIDQTKPEGKITYFINNQWTTHGETWTNKPVTVKISTTDIHSGLHATAVSWDHQATWIAIDSGSNTKTNDAGNSIDGYATKTFEKNVKDTVYIRDAVGNIQAFPYEVSGIDIKSPIVFPGKKPTPSDVTDEPLPVDPDDTDYDDSDPTYTYENLGKLTYDWVNSNVLISFKSRDDEDVRPGYSVSGIYQMRIYESDSSFTKGSLLVSSNSASVSYLCETQGITYYVIEAEDNASNVTQVNLTVKLDKTAPIIVSNGDRLDFNIQDINLDNYGIDEVESFIKDTELMKRSFLFNSSDYNDPANGKITREDDSSGIESFTVRLINSSDSSDYIDYTMNRVSGTVVNTYEFTSESAIKAVLASKYDNKINTFAEFPNAATLDYRITIVDRAGNKTVYDNKAGNEIKNFSIKAVIHYAGVADEDENAILSADGSNENLNIVQEDEHGKRVTIPYFQTGDFGYVEAWTIGYVPEISFDFETIGDESSKEILTNKLARKYNLGITSNLAFIRTVDVSKAQEIQTSFPKVNNIPYAAHYGVFENNIVKSGNYLQFSNRFLSDGTAIRLPIYYELKTDGTKKNDGSDNFEWEVHKAVIRALKINGTFRDNSEAMYVIWDTKQTELHHRITHES